eukprot:scaffold121873_cov25-Phaeocystis_antarctica.AAC.1
MRDGRDATHSKQLLARTRDTPRAKQSYTENFHRPSHTAHRRRHPAQPWQHRTRSNVRQRLASLARRRHTAAARLAALHRRVAASRLATVVVAAVIVATVVSRVAAAAVLLTSALLPARCGADALLSRLLL